MDNSYSLFEFCSSIRRCLEFHYKGKFWVHAEISDFRQNKSSGHCYFELIQKGENDRIVAQAKATIWSSSAYTLLNRFYRETGTPLQNGLEVMFLVSVNFHEQFGFSLNVSNIDPAYTLGEMARKRREIIERIQREGLLDQNKSLPMPRLFQRLAVITSSTAAGWGDFLNHISDTPEGFVFYTHLYPAVMQGKDTESTIIKALDKIYRNRDCYDAVVIIRGGGAQSELASFDTYELAKACATFPLPIISGIGHDRDQSVVDIVAAIPMKTPTAVADFLIHHMRVELTLQEEFKQRIKFALSELMAGYYEKIDKVSMRIPVSSHGKLVREKDILSYREKLLNSLAKKKISEADVSLSGIVSKLPSISMRSLETSRQKLILWVPRIKMLADKRMVEMRTRLELYEQTVKLSDPQKILAKGFVIVSHEDGKICCSAESLSPGEEVILRFHDGDCKATIE